MERLGVGKERHRKTTAIRSAGRMGLGRVAEPFEIILC
jgi:hypothetical protein